jgi:hypothetical protein
MLEHPPNASSETADDMVNARRQYRALINLGFFILLPSGRSQSRDNSRPTEDV